MNTNELRERKRNRNWNNRVPSDAPHVMMKNEAKVMRRLQAETGLSEEEIRQVKKYRKMLSEAQAHGNKNEAMRRATSLLKQVTRELKLAKEHPKVVNLAMSRAKRAEEGMWWRQEKLKIFESMKELLHQ